MSHKKPKNILFVLPTHFASRNILMSDIPTILSNGERGKATFVSLYPEDGERIRAFGSESLSWHHQKRPEKLQALLGLAPLVNFLRNICYKIAHLLFLKRASHAALVYRFNNINNFFGHRLRRSMAHWFRIKLPWQPKTKSHFSAQRYADPKLGWPLASSTKVYGFLHSLYFWNWGNNPRVEAFFENNHFDLVVINYIQTARIFHYLNAAKRRDIPVIGMVGSWDNPTLKGPVAPGLCRYLVQNRYMAEQLINHHRILEKDIAITGWPQMDIYCKEDVIIPRRDLLTRLGLAAESKVILFGANTKRLGRHEPSIMQHIIQQIQAGRYGDQVALVIRPHPGDRLWKERYAKFMNQERVVVQEPSYTDRADFANLVKHSDIVISSAGTISLDAAAFDTCAINIAFDGNLEVSEKESVAMYYKLEHYASIVETGGTLLVHSFAGLDRAIIRYLADPALDQKHRQALRDYHLAPLDGQSAARMAAMLLDFECIQSKVS